jgi:xanthine dehydrogenase accessory factor
MTMSDVEIIEKLADLLRDGRPVAVATVAATKGSAPREGGARMLVFPDGSIEGTVGGGILEKRVIEEALAMMHGGAASRLMHFSLTKDGVGAACGGEADVLVEVFMKRRKILVVGAGHVGVAVARVAAEAGFFVTVVEDRPEPVGAGKLPPGFRMLAVRPDDPAILGEVDDSTAVVIVTRGHELDHEALRLLASSPAFYVGMIGSRKKTAAVLAKLREEGVAEKMLERVFSPIGLDIGAETPGEIAVAIVSEIIAVLRSGGTPSMSLKGTVGAG